MNAAVDTLCGDFSYVVVDPNDSDNVVSWISIAPHSSNAGYYTITAEPTDETFRDASPLTYELWTTLDNYYPTHHVGKRDTLTVTVQDAVCDCSEVVWDPPSLVIDAHAVAQGMVSVSLPTGSINQANSEAINPKIRQCYSSGAGCAETSTFVVTLYDGGALPDFIVQNVDAVEITPLDYTDIGEWLLNIE